MRLRERMRLVWAYWLSGCAFLWRRLVFRTTFIAVTGSVGKTTATNALGAILSADAPTNWTPGGSNAREYLARNVLRTRFHHRFAVIEVGTRAPGALRRAAWMIAPDVVVVLRVLNVHSDAFPTLREMSAEKEQLLTRLRRRGRVFLNADDPLVMEMGTRSRGPVRTFGRAAGSGLRATDVSSRWPDRLRFLAHRGDESHWVYTNFVGEHLLASSLAAFAVAVDCGVSMERAAARFSDIEPVAGRMRPQTLPNGAIVLRDDFNPTLPTLEAALDVLRDAQVARRVVLVGDILDTGLTVRPRMRDIGRRVARVADLAVFVGDDARTSAKAAVLAGMPEQAARGFRTLSLAAAFLASELRAGDLVLVHGWQGRHIERVILAQLGNIACWKGRCHKFIPCDQCPELGLIPVKDLAAMSRSSLE